MLWNTRVLVHKLSSLYDCTNNLKNHETTGQSNLQLVATSLSYRFDCSRGMISTFSDILFATESLRPGKPFSSSYALKLLVSNSVALVQVYNSYGVSTRILYFSAMSLFEI
jgi:hypothetical protein